MPSDDVLDALGNFGFPLFFCLCVLMGSAWVVRKLLPVGVEVAQTHIQAVRAQEELLRELTEEVRDTNRRVRTIEEAVLRNG